MGHLTGCGLHGHSLVSFLFLAAQSNPIFFSCFEFLFVCLFVVSVLSMDQMRASGSPGFEEPFQITCLFLLLMTHINTCYVVLLLLTLPMYTKLSTTHISRCHALLLLLTVPMHTMLSTTHINTCHNLLLLLTVPMYTSYPLQK